MARKARLSMLAPMIGTLAPMIGYQGGSETARNRYRDSTQHYRAWYKTSRWQKLRWRVLTAAAFTCARCGRVCVKKHEAHCDHRVPHRGKAELFWDERNLQCLCAECHDSAKQAAEKAMQGSGG